MKSISLGNWLTIAALAITLIGGYALMRANEAVMQEQIKTLKENDDKLEAKIDKLIDLALSGSGSK